jgi:ssDNA-binding Zn-finger/Zn-ribbon topoisomerase 1
MYHRRPDCGVTMEAVKFGMADAWDPYVNTGEKRTGLLGKLGTNERTAVTTVTCPECGLIRHYAEFDEE